MTTQSRNQREETGTVRYIEPCPPWCRRGHRIGEMHLGARQEVALSHMPAVEVDDGEHAPDTVATYLFRPVEETRIHLGHGEDAGVTLTLGEAHRLREDLDHLLWLSGQ